MTDNDMKHAIKYRLIDELDDYLYDYSNFNSKYRDVDSMKRFDFLDMVIIDTDPTILPWMKMSHELMILMNMCKAIDKPLLAMGGGFGQLVYYCSTLGKQIKVVNGNERGSALSNLQNIPGEKLDKLIDNYHMFLEDLTGDFYGFNKDK